MGVTTRFVDDPSQDADLPGVDPRYYQKRVGAGDPWDTGYAIRQATAAAKDSARKKLIKTIQDEEEKARQNSLMGLGETHDRNAIGSSLAEREIDGVKGAPDNAIDLE